MEEETIRTEEDNNFPLNISEIAKLIEEKITKSVYKFKCEQKILYQMNRFQKLNFQMMIAKRHLNKILIYDSIVFRVGLFVVHSKQK